jgi:colanic acid/amylovoran biosynthesis protein
MGVTRNILISGAEVANLQRSNRGAEQLLTTAAQRLSGRSYTPVVTAAKVDRQLVNRLGMKQYLGNPRAQPIDRLIPPLDVAGFVSVKALGGVFDASGYALGDPWGTHTAEWISRKYRQWSSQSLPIVALPQAYGPFEQVEVADAARIALNQCRLIYAREETSYDYLMKLGIDPTVCRIAPDVTLAEKPELHNQRPKANRLVVVPNWNLLERGGGDHYMKCLAEVAAWADSRGLEVVGLLHEGSKDLAILQSLAGTSSIRIIDQMTGWDIKRYISNSRIVLSGRYHAVAAALSTGTLVVAHSWSHKYQELLNVYGVDWLADPSDSTSTIDLLSSLLDDGSPTDLGAKQHGISAKIENVWDEIFDVLGADVDGSDSTVGRK